MDSVLTNFLKYNVCKYCRMQLAFGDDCCVKEQVIKLYDKGVITTTSTLSDIFEYCKKHKRKYDKIYDVLNIYLNLED